MSVGMPQGILLRRFGVVCAEAFGVICAYQVGSSLQKKEWRDVDVRVMLPDDVYAEMGLGDPEHPQHNRKWVAFTLAFSALGKQMTGLPIDFQLQQVSHANANNDGVRNALLAIENS